MPMFEVKVWVDVGPKDGRSERAMKRAAKDAVRQGVLPSLVRGMRRISFESMAELDAYGREEESDGS